MMEWPGEWKLRPGATAKAVADFAHKAARALKVDPKQIPTEYLDFLHQSNGAEGQLGEATIFFEPMNESLRMGKDYLFADRGWLLIGRDGAGGGFGIDLTKDPPTYFWASYIDLIPRYMGTTLQQFLEALESGIMPTDSADQGKKSAGEHEPGMIAEATAKRGVIMGWTPELHVLYGINWKYIIAELDTRTGQTVRKYEVPVEEHNPGNFSAAAVSPDGKLLAAALRRKALSGEASLVLFDRATGLVRWNIDLGVCGGYREHGADDTVGYVYFTPDSQQVIFQTSGKPLRFLDAATGQIVGSMDIPTDAADAGRIANDKRLAIAADGRIAMLTPKGVAIYDASGKQQAEFAFRGDYVAWSDDLSKIMVATAPQIYMIDPATGRELQSYAVNINRAPPRLLQDVDSWRWTATAYGSGTQPAASSSACCATSPALNI